MQLAQFAVFSFDRLTVIAVLRIFYSACFSRVG